MLVCVEGVDGAGKHTQAEMLAKALQENGIASKIYTYPDYNSAYKFGYHVHHNNISRFGAPIGI